MRIEKSIDWQQVGLILNRELALIPYNADLHKMFMNIQNMVRDLSMREVDARREKNLKRLQPQIEQINKSIDHFEKLIFIAKLMK